LGRRGRNLSLYGSVHVCWKIDEVRKVDVTSGERD
jgi:hypothetical protein